ncbi:MAG: hypothetical protein A2033_01565 [Bacteroidetes bacterium GWA2_31_9]|nr:MAG: hypothetical protein A2033_01565 [Bacteroidetes bacterium GWA2_31_9]
MPTILNVNGFKFKFYSNENRELPHIHITKGNANTKIWLEPDIIIAYSYNFSSREQREIETLIKQNYQTLINSWYEYFG